MEIERAIANNDLEQLSALITPENVNTIIQRPYFYFTPLTLALKSGKRPNLETINLLLDRGANVNYFDNNLRSPLTFAIENRYTPVPVLIRLLDAGANPNGLLRMAAYNENLNAIAILYARGARMSPEEVDRLRGLIMYETVAPLLIPLMALDLADPVATQAFFEEQRRAGRLAPEVMEELRAAGQRLREARAGRRRGPALSAWAEAQMPPRLRRTASRRTASRRRRGGRRSTRRRSI